MADGTIIIETDLETDKLKNKLDKLNNDIERQTGKVKSLQAEYDKLLSGEGAPAVNPEFEKLTKQLDKADAALEEYRAEIERVRETTKHDLALAATPEQKENTLAIQAAQEEELERKYAKQIALVEMLEGQLANTPETIGDSTAEAEKLRLQLEQAQIALEGMQTNARGVEAQLEKTQAPTGQMQQHLEAAQNVLGKFENRLKTIAKKVFVFTMITAALQSVKTYMGEALAANESFQNSLASLKGTLRTAFQPILDFIIPILQALINVLNAAIGYVAKFTSWLFGSTVQASSAAAKALYDQTNATKAAGAAAEKAKKQMSGLDEMNTWQSGSAGGGGGGSGTIAPDFSAQEFDSAFLDKTAERVRKIAADVWAMLNNIKDFIVNFLSGKWEDAIDDIISFCGNARNLIVDLLEFVDYIVGNGIDLIIEKFGLAETPIGDMLESVKGMFHDSTQFIVALLNGDLDGMKESLDSFFEHFKNFGSALLDFVNQGINSLLDWIDEATNGRFKSVITTIKQYVSGLVDSVKQIFGGLIDFISGVFTGNWKKAWTGILNILGGVWNAIVSVVEGALNLIMDGVRTIVNKASDGLNLIPGVNIDPKGEDWGRVSLGTIKVPRLAQGAVIPANREFMAVLGDQKNGRNLEAPEDLIRQIVREESGNGQYTFIAQLDGRTIFKEVIDQGKLSRRMTGKNAFALGGV